MWAQNAASAELSAATVGEEYRHTLDTNKHADFIKIDGPEWLKVTPEGVVYGTPNTNAPKESTIRVRALRSGEPSIDQTFVVPVQPFDCGRGAGDAFGWCNDSAPPQPRPAKTLRFAFEPVDKLATQPEAPPDCPPDQADGCIVQFDRLLGPTGSLGHFNPDTDKIHWRDERQVRSVHENAAAGAPDLTEPIVNAINGSKVLLSGSVLIRRGVEACTFWSWSVVAQTTDSSNNLFYGPADVSAFCANGTIFIVLPAHAIWASVYGIPADTNNPSWRPLPAPPAGHECWTGLTTAATTGQGIKPCDTQTDGAGSNGVNSDEKSSWLLRDIYYSPLIEKNYNRVTQPGVSQGSISMAPIMGVSKATWDAQGYESWLQGPGWVGFQMMYEHDCKPADDFNSLTAAVMYDVRVHNKPGYWGHWGAKTGKHEKCAKGVQEECIPPIAGVRPLEFSVRAGPEWAPTDEFVKISKSMVRVQAGLNMVGSATLRLPFILSPFRQSYVKQPSQFTIVPVAGIEGGWARNLSHGAGARRDFSRSRGRRREHALALQPHPELLGDRPITRLLLPDKVACLG